MTNTFAPTRSAELRARAVRRIPGGVDSNVRLTAPAIFFERAHGARLWDVDGNDYVDYVLGQGPSFLGHANPIVNAAVADACSHGMVFGAQHPLEVEACELTLDAIGWADMIRMGMTGTECVQAALRAARAATGRRNFVRFDGHYHGWLDNVLIQGDGSGGVASDGQLASQLADCYLLPWNDAEPLAELLRTHGESIAAIIMEPMMANTGSIEPRPGYLQRVRELCDEYGVVLIFDEVITGFRIARGGAVERYGVVPDLATYGKAMAGGWPVAALAGRADLMEPFGTGAVNHSGTFNGSVMAAAAVVATQQILAETPPYDQVEAYGRRLIEGLSAIGEKYEVPLHIQGVPVAFHVSFGAPEPVYDVQSLRTLDLARYGQFASRLAQHGLWIAQRGIWYISSAHTDDELHQTLDRFDEAYAEQLPVTRRVGVIGVWHETNTYSAHSTSLADFEAFELLTGDSIIDRNQGTGSVIGGFYDSADLDLVPVFSAGAWPSGTVEGEVMDEILARVQTGLMRAGPLDGLLVNLHGAMVAENRPDVEAAVLQVARDVVGDVPIGGVLDLHANPSPELIASCDVLVSYDTYPHVDMRERGLEVATMMSEMMTGRRLRTTLRKIPLLVCPLAQATDHGPLRELQLRAQHRAQAAESAGVARVCVVGGFAYSDVDRAGMSVLVVHDSAGEDAAQDVIDATVADIAEHAGDFAVVRDDAATAVRRAMESTKNPVFLADVADNIGGGSPGDGTVLLAELLAAGATGAVVMIADREVALQAELRGVGAELDVLLGGKTDRMHGDPIRIRARVERITDGNYRAGGYYMTGRTFTMGVTAVLSIAGNTVVVTEIAVPPFHPEQLSSVGVDVSRASIVVVKGALAWRGAYEDVAGEIIEVATPGVCPIDVSTLPRRAVPMAC